MWISGLKGLSMPTNFVNSSWVYLKTTDFYLVFHFEQTRTVSIFGEHGTMAHIP